MITPVRLLLTRLIHVSPNCWTIYRSFEIHLEMGTVSWIGLQIQCFMPGLFLRKMLGTRFGSVGTQTLQNPAKFTAKLQIIYYK